MALLQNAKCTSLPTLRNAAKAAVKWLLFSLFFFTDGLLLNQNIDAITAILSAGTPQTYSLFCFSPPCLSNQFRLNHNQPLHLFSSLFPSPTIPPPLSNFAFPLDLCVMTWLGWDRRYTQDCLHREKERDRARERHRHECHTDRNNPSDKHKWMCTHFLSLSHATMHCHIQSHNESIWMNPNWTLCESNHSS